MIMWLDLILRAVFNDFGIIKIRIIYTSSLSARQKLSFEIPILFPVRKKFQIMSEWREATNINVWSLKLGKFNVKILTLLKSSV